jgi:L-threonylcarbamoyladenylate synthase
MNIISNCTASILKDAASKLKEGRLVAFPTETVYGLGADAQNERSVARIYEVKARPKDHPLIVHISSIKNLDKWARKIPEYAFKLATAFWPGPMTLVLPRTNIAKNFITGGQDCVGIRVPDQAVAHGLLNEFENLGGLGVAAPSANRFGKVSPTTALAVESELGNFLAPFDIILDGGPSQVGVESTIIDCTRGNPVILRPGGVTTEMIEKLLSIEVRQLNKTDSKVNAPGKFVSHYAPNAKIFMNGTPQFGDGFIALSSVPTPSGAIRLASPKDNTEYAQILYNAFRLADFKELQNIHIIAPENKGIAVAINDRIKKASKF